MLLENKHSARFRQVACNVIRFGYGELVDVYQGEMFVILEPLNLTKEMTNPNRACQAAAELRSIADISATRQNPGQLAWIEARNELIKLGEIKGFLAMSIRGELFWISHFDVDYLQC